MQKEKAITEPNLNNETTDYWNKVLKTHGLTMKRGLQPKFIEYRGVVGRVDPKPRED